MRNTSLLAAVATCVAFPCCSADIEDLIKKNGLYYDLEADSPFSGEIGGQDSGFFKEGLKNGRWIYHHLNGQVKSEGDFQDGQEQGTWLGYYENGQVFFEGSYLSGVKEGLWVSYYDDGKIFYRGHYKDGKEDGRWVGFNPDGSVWPYRTGHFRDGVKVSE